MAKVEWADAIKTVSGALVKINKKSPHAADQKMVLGTHRTAPTTNTACSRIYLRGLSSVTRSTPFTAEDLARQLRFKTVSAAVAARMKDPAKMIADNTAFNAQSTYKTMKSYLWALEKATYDQQNG
ncbi:MAG: hypothetical protein IJP52_04855 [Paludibacteraceae bacterium]|nr:hypothetical protein [Paludibacteraceae bacterium]